MMMKVPGSTKSLTVIACFMWWILRLLRNGNERKRICDGNFLSSFPPSFTLTWFYCTFRSKLRSFSSCDNRDFSIHASGTSLSFPLSHLTMCTILTKSRARMSTKFMEVDLGKRRESGRREIPSFSAFLPFKRTNTYTYNYGSVVYTFSLSFQDSPVRVKHSLLNQSNGVLTNQCDIKHLCCALTTLFTATSGSCFNFWACEMGRVNFC